MIRHLLCEDKLRNFQLEILLIFEWLNFRQKLVIILSIRDILRFFSILITLVKPFFGEQSEVDLYPAVERLFNEERQQRHIRHGTFVLDLIILLFILGLLIFLFILGLPIFFLFFVPHFLADSISQNL